MEMYVKHGLVLLSGFDTICNDLGKNDSHICAITPKGLVNLKLFRILIKPSFT